MHSRKIVATVAFVLARACAALTCSTQNTQNGSLQATTCRAEAPKALGVEVVTFVYNPGIKRVCAAILVAHDAFLSTSRCLLQDSSGDWEKRDHAHILLRRSEQHGGQLLRLRTVLRMGGGPFALAFTTRGCSSDWRPAPLPCCEPQQAIAVIETHWQWRQPFDVDDLSAELRTSPALLAPCTGAAAGIAETYCSTALSGERHSDPLYVAAGKIVAFHADEAHGVATATSVAYFRRWILSTLQQFSSCPLKIVEVNGGDMSCTAVQEAACPTVSVEAIRPFAAIVAPAPKPKPVSVEALEQLLPQDLQWFLQGTLVEASNGARGRVQALQGDRIKVAFDNPLLGNQTLDRINLRVIEACSGNCDACANFTTCIQCRSGFALVKGECKGLLVGPSSGVRKIAAGDHHSLFLRHDGQLYAAGDNSYGQLGDGTTTWRSLPMKVNLTGVEELVAGYRSSFFLGKGGELHVAGAHVNGWPGPGQVDVHQPLALPRSILDARIQSALPDWTDLVNFRSDGSVYAAKFADYVRQEHDHRLATKSPLPVPLNGVLKVAAAYRCLIFLKSDGQVYALGYNSNGRFGDGSTVDSQVPRKVPIARVIDVAAGRHHTLFLRGDGKAFAAGYNAYGQLGDGSKSDRHSLVQVPLTGIQSIAAGEFHSLFLLNNGTVYATGHNAFGQFGDGTTLDRSLPKPVATSWESLD